MSSWSQGQKELAAKIRAHIRTLTAEPGREAQIELLKSRLAELLCNFQPWNEE